MFRMIREEAVVLLASDIEQVIIQLIETLRSHLNLPETPRQRNWWVLVCGDALHQDSPAERDKARERLRQQLILCDIRLQEYVWIWDSTNRVQVLVNQFANQDDAEVQAEALRKKGLEVRVVREWNKNDPLDKDLL